MRQDEDLLPSARLRDQQAARPQRRQRLGAEIATVARARRQIVGRDRRLGRRGDQRAPRDRAARFGGHAIEPGRRHHRGAAAAPVAPQRSEAQIGDRARRDLQVDGPTGAVAAEIGGHRGGQAVFERRPRLDRAALEDVGHPRLRQPRQRRRRARADLRAERHPHRLEARERRLVDRQHQPQERAPLVDHLRGERDDVGPLVGPRARAPPRGDRGSGPAPPSPRAPRRPGSRPDPGRGPAGRCRAGWSRGPAPGRDRGSSPG